MKVRYHNLARHSSHDLRQRRKKVGLNDIVAWKMSSGELFSLSLSLSSLHKTHISFVTGRRRLEESLFFAYGASEE